MHVFCQALTKLTLGTRQVAFVASSLLPDGSAAFSRVVSYWQHTHAPSPRALTDLSPFCQDVALEGIVELNADSVMAQAVSLDNIDFAIHGMAPACTCMHETRAQHDCQRQNSQVTPRSFHGPPHAGLC